MSRGRTQKRIPKQAPQYKPKGQRNIGRPRERWSDQFHLEDQGTGNTPNLSWTWWWRYILLLISFAIFVSYNIYSFQCTAFFHDVTVNVKVAPHKFQKKICSSTPELMYYVLLREAKQMFVKESHYHKVQETKMWKCKFPKIHVNLYDIKWRFNPSWQTVGIFLKVFIFDTVCIVCVRACVCVSVLVSGRGRKKREHKRGGAGVILIMSRLWRQNIRHFDWSVTNRVVISQ